MTHEIEIIEDYGHIVAYMVETPAELLEYVPDFPGKYYQEICQVWDTEIQNTFIYISDIFIIPEFRRRGLATEFLEKFLQKYSENIFLIAGSLETPKNFEIVTFYESYGFDLLSLGIDYPLMYKK